MIFFKIKGIIEENEKRCIMGVKNNWLKQFSFRLTIVIFLGVLVLTKPLFAQGRSGYGRPIASYKAAQGLTITSYCPKWDTYSKLRAISQELLSNEHGKELAFLKNIYLYPDSPDGVLAYTHYDLSRDYKGDYIYGDQTYIEIFDANQYNNVKEMAWLLSHEYGHHFTIYHMVKAEKQFFDQWRTSGYARARQLTNHPKVSYQTDANCGSHKWDIMEIAAEDYVQIFGSDNARSSVIYKDIQEKIEQNTSGQFNFEPGFNMSPQENLEIPLASDVAGLEQYWRNAANLPQQVQLPIPPKPRLRLVSQKEVARDYYQYRIQWDQALDGKDYEYTLVSYPDGEYGFPYPIKTVKAGEATFARVGNGLKTNLQTGSQNLIIDDYRGRYTFVLYMKDANHKVYASDPFHVNFNYPLIEQEGLYKDMHPSDWSYDSVRQLNERSMMVGSPDQYFYPLMGVTYSEFATVLSRVFGENIQLKNPSQRNYLTRDDVALLLHAYLGSKDFSFKPRASKLPFIDHAHIANQEAVNALYDMGILGGYKGYFYPKNNISRQELASLMMRTLKYQSIIKGGEEDVF